MVTDFIFSQWYHLQGMNCMVFHIEYLKVCLHGAPPYTFYEPHGSELSFIVLFVQVSLLSQFFIRWS